MTLHVPHRLQAPILAQKGKQRGTRPIKELLHLYKSEDEGGNKIRGALVMAMTM
jgi:hypothetical protein